MAKVQVNQTVLTGVLVYPFILYSQPENGNAPSRANAKDWREAAKTCTELSTASGIGRGVPYHARAHHILHDDDDSPDRQRALLSKAVEEDVGHRLSASRDGLDVGAHAEGEGHVDS